MLGDFQAALDGGYMVAIDTAVTPELAQEGMARELVHRIQNMRRAAGFEVTDRIELFYQGPEEVDGVLAGFGDYVRLETLTEAIHDGEAADDAHVQSHKAGWHGGSVGGSEGWLGRHWTFRQV